MKKLIYYKNKILQLKIFERYNYKKLLKKLNDNQILKQAEYYVWIENSWQFSLIGKEIEKRNI